MIVLQFKLSGKTNYTGAILEENIWGRVRQKVDDLFLVVTLKTQDKNTKSTTPTLQKCPRITVCWFYYCTLLL